MKGMILVKHSRVVRVLLIFYLCQVGPVPAGAELKQLHYPRNSLQPVTFLVIGDWGRRGHFNQSSVAHQMGKTASRRKVNFFVSVGDNFYDDGLQSVDDAAFLDSFVHIYKASTLQRQWYNVLGNHDYRGDVLAQLSPRLREIDRRWLCMRSFTVHTGIAHLFFLDTTPFVEAYFKNPKDHVYDWRRILPREKYIRRMLEDMDLALNMSTACWKFVIGHHPIRSDGHHGDTQELVQLLLPILKRHGVDFYLNGHDHCLQRIIDLDSPLQFVTSGGGSKAWKGNFRSDRMGTKFYYDGQGFLSVKLKPTFASLTFYDVFGNVLHEWERSKTSQLVI